MLWGQSLRLPKSYGYNFTVAQITKQKMTEEKLYKNVEVESVKIKDVSIGLRQYGKGKDIVLIHGFPTHGYTWRKILPALSKEFRCTLLDLPGLGDSQWSKNADFSSTAQANYITELLKQKGVKKCSIIAHNSGATVARIIAIEQAQMIEDLILINTEIPNHRPPWIPFYQSVGLLPLVPFFIRTALKYDWFVKSPMGFREAYTDKKMFANKENLDPYLQPILKSKDKTIGAFKYLKGIDWKVIDEFKHTHKNIKANTMLIWGEDDKTFPIEIGKQMIEQFNSNCEFHAIKNASLLPHEEKPKEVQDLIIGFIKKIQNEN